MEKWKHYFNHKIDSKNYVTWTREQKIKWTQFEDKPGDGGTYWDYFGVYFVWEKKEKLKFNVTVFLDKSKSWVKPKSDWRNISNQFDRIPELLKLKFDYYECGARQLRKYLTEHSAEITDDSGPILDEYYSKTRDEWEQIQNDLGDNLTDNNLSSLRITIDNKLEELKDFDSKLNSDL